MIQILKDSEIYKEFDVSETEEQTMLRKAKLRAELLTRDNDGDFSARIKPVEPVEPDETA